MIIVKRYFDDAYGKVHTVQRETFRNLVLEDCKLDIPPITTSDDLKGYLRKYILVSKLGKWIAQEFLNRDQSQKTSPTEADEVDLPYFYAVTN